MFQIAKGLAKAGWILLTMPIPLWRLSIASLAVVEFSIGVMATTPELLEQTQLKEGKSPEAAKATARYGRIIAKGILWFTFLLPYIWFLATSAATMVLIVAGISLIAIGSIFATIMIVAATIAAWPTFVPWLVDNVHIDIPLISGVANAQTVTRIVAVAIVSLIAWSIYRTQNKRVKKLETLWEDQFGRANLAPIRKTPPSKWEIYIQRKLETWKGNSIQPENQRRRDKKRRQESRAASKAKPVYKDRVAAWLHLLQSAGKTAPDIEDYPDTLLDMARYVVDHEIYWERSVEAESAAKQLISGWRFANSKLQEQAQTTWDETSRLRSRSKSLVIDDVMYGGKRRTEYPKGWKVSYPPTSTAKLQQLSRVLEENKIHWPIDPEQWHTESAL